MRPPLLAPLLIAALSVTPAAATTEIVLRLATTTSTADTGLFDVLLPPFQAASGIRVDVIPVGTGKALKLAGNGDVDIVLVHSRKAEDTFLAAGHGTRPVDVMRNDFVIVGPADDPAGVKSEKDAPAALAAVAAKGARFASRGDGSGTHDREMDLWTAAGIATFGPWRLETGQGMADTLRIADEKGAYCLADRATFTAFEGRLKSRILHEGGETLLNRYRVILAAPGKHPGTKFAAATRFADWLVSPAGQAIIRDFRRNGRALFIPDAVQ